MPGMGRGGAGKVFISGSKGEHLMMCLPLELRPEVSEGTSRACVWGRSISGRESSKYKGPEASLVPDE